MIFPMDKSSAPQSMELAQHLYKKNIELANELRKSAKSKVPSDPNIWLQMRENYESIILEDFNFSEKRGVESALWQLHYKRIDEFRSHINSAMVAQDSAAQTGKGLARSERIKKVRAAFKSFLSEATGFYHDLIQKVRAKYGLPLGYFPEGPESRANLETDAKKSAEFKKGLLSCHRCLIYLGDLSRYKGLYGEGDSVNRDYAAASAYYTQAASLWPSSGNPHHQLAILASYHSDDLVAVYRYFRSLAADTPFPTARDNLILVFEKNRQNYSELPHKTKSSPFKTMPTQMNGRGRGRVDTKVLAKNLKTEVTPKKEQERSVPEMFKSFLTRFLRINGILFTRTSLETFGEIFSTVISDLLELLASGPDEELNFGPSSAENALVVVRLITILIFTVHNVKRESEGQSYAEILQRSLLLQYSFTAAFELAGHIVKRCMQLHDASASYLLPGILVFIEWLACHPDIASGNDMDERVTAARSFFWNQFVAFVNMLLLSGLVVTDGEEDETCFVEMSGYDEGETGNRLALWEDFELRGFSPLAPAHIILDFSSNHSLGSHGSNKEKKARMQRILAAGRALVNVVKIDQHGIYFDSKMRKFVIGKEPFPSGGDIQLGFAGTSDANKQEAPVENRVDFVNVQSNSQGRRNNLEDEEDDEVIVFKPTVTEKYRSGPISSAYEAVPLVQDPYGGDSNHIGELSASQHVLPQTISNSTSHDYMTANLGQQPMQHGDPSASKWMLDQGSFISNGLRSLAFDEKEYRTKAGFLDASDALQSTTHSFPFSLSVNGSTHNMPSLPLPMSNKGCINGNLSGQIKNVDMVIPSKLDSIVPSGLNFDGVASKRSTAATTNTRKNPVSRPVRHFGPPPGFNHVPLKQPEDSSFASKDQHPLEDDYSWLDGYQPPSFKLTMNDNSSKNIAQMFSSAAPSCTGSFASVTSFPFPGKQIPAVHTELDDASSWRDIYPEQFQVNQLNTLTPEQYNAQWPSRYFV